jgi:hypothetical protein
VYYKAVFLDASGRVVATGPQGVSAEAAGVSLAGGTAGTASGPPPPTALSATSTSTQVTLTWTSGGGTTAGFNVYRDGLPIGNVTAPPFVDTGLTPATSYTYTVSAYEAGGITSAPSAPFTITTQGTISITISPALVTLAPGGSQGFKAAVTGTSNTSVTWSLGSPVGTISPAGIYIAPGKVPIARKVPIIATSVADPTVSSTAIVTVQPAPGSARTGAGSVQ